MPPTSPRNADRSISSFARATKLPLIDLAIRFDDVVPECAAPLLDGWEYGLTGRAIELALRQHSCLEYTTCYVARARPERLAYLDLAPAARAWEFALAEAGDAEHPWYLRAIDDLAGRIRDELGRGAEFYLPDKQRYLRLRDTRAPLAAG